MTRPRVLVVAVVALVLVLVAAGLGLGQTRPRPGAETLVAVAVLAGLVAGARQLYRTRSLALDGREEGDEPPEEAFEGVGEFDGTGADGTRDAGAPADEEASLAPERTPQDRPLSGTRLAARTTEAAEAAREADSLAAGVETVRPLLRATLGRVLLESGYSRAGAERAMRSGEWTDDRVAAAVVDPAVELPERSLRERVRAWLYPDRVLRTYTRRTTAEITAVADERLPAIPGGDAPRPVPTTATPVERLTRSVDGAVQEAEDPLASPGGDQLPPPEEADVRAVHERLGLEEEP